jgi:hypothetical protein
MSNSENNKSKKRKITSSNQTEVQNTNNIYCNISCDDETKIVTPIKLLPNNNNENKKASKEMNNDNDDDMIDVFSLFDSIKNDTTSSDTAVSNYVGNQTVVDVVKVFSSSIQGSILVAFVLSNFYGGRHYINNNINKATKLMYQRTIENVCSDKINIPNKSDVSYLVHKNNRPVVLVSSIPKVENQFSMESMKETLQTLTETFQGKPDPENKGKFFKFNYLPDFIMNTHQQKKSFAFICKSIILPERLTYSHQTNIEHYDEENNENK